MTTTVCLSSGAELVIQNMHLMSKEEETVRCAIRKYARPQGCCTHMCWLIYRIVQAVKSLFGCSDWQVAMTVMKDRFMCIAVEQGVVQKNPQSKVEKEFREYIAERVSFLPHTMLDVAVTLQEHAIDADHVTNGVPIRDTLSDIVSSLNNLRSDIRT